MAKQSHRGGLRLWSERVAGVVLFFNRLFPLIGSSRCFARTSRGQFGRPRRPSTCCSHSVDAYYWYHR